MSRLNPEFDLEGIAVELLMFRSSSWKCFLTVKMVPDRSQRGIEQAKCFVLLVKQYSVRRFRRNTISYADHRAASCINTRPTSASDTRQQSRTISSALFGLNQLNLASVNVCLNLPPKRGTSAPASKSDSFNRDV